MKTLKKGKAMHLTKFAKMLEYPRVTNREFKRVLKFLENQGLVIIQQGGFLGHSMYHPKIITILKPLELDTFKQVVFSRTNFKIGEFTVHKTREKRKCERCSHVIDFGERYGSKVQLGRRSYRGHRKGRAIVISQNIVCLSCLLEEAGIEGIEVG